MNEQSSELSREELLARYSSKATVAAAEATRRSPFKFLDSYDLEDADIFFGRDSEIDELLGHFHSYGHVLIYGESGCGKSSLVQCGLRSRIPDADAMFIPLRVHAKGLPTLCRQICDSASQRLGSVIEVDSDAGLVDTLRTVRAAASRPLVLFFDQFEELFLFHDLDVRQQFANELASIRSGQLNVKVIIGIRQDYLAHLSELEETVAGVFDNRFWLRRMSRENAADAVVKACGYCDVKIDAELAQTILRRLDPGGHGIELPYLQVVMDRLYRQAVNNDSTQPEITAQEVEKLGDIANILAMFLVEEVAKLPSPDTGRQILKAFVTREGTRRNLDREAVTRDAASFGEAIEPEVLDAHLNQLASVRVLREIADSGTYELRHDTLAATVSGWISEVEKELIEVRDNLINRFKEYEARGKPDEALLDQGFLDYLAVYRERLGPLLSDPLRQYMEDSQRHVGQTQRFRRRVRQLITGVVGTIILGCLVVAVLQWSAAAQREQEANANFVTAERQRKRADENAKTAALREKQAKDLLEQVQEEKQRTQAELLKSERLLYVNHIQSAHREWKSNNAASAWQHLNECQERFRGWEYHYLNHLTARNFETFEGHTGTGRGSAVVFSPDGSQIVSASTDGVLKRWDAITRELASTVTLKEFDFDQVDSMAFRSDCSHVVAVGFTRDSSQVKVWNTSTGEPTVTINPGFRTNIYAVAFSPDGSRVVAGIKPKPGESRLALWDSRTGEEMWSTESGLIFAVAFSPDGSRIVSGHMPDGTLTVWDMSTGKATLTLRGHTAGVNAVAFSPDGSKIVSGSNDETLIVWDAGTGKQLLRLNGHNHAVLAAAFSPDGSRIVSGSQDKTLKLWDASTGTEMQTLKGPKDAPFIVDFNPDGSRVVSASGTTIQLWNPSAKPKSLTFYAHQNVGPNYVVFNPEGTRIVTFGGNDVHVKVWDSTTGGRTLTFGDWKGPRYKSPIALSPDGRLIVAQTKDGRLTLLDAATGEETLTLEGHTGRVAAVAFSYDGTRIVSADSNWATTDSGNKWIVGEIKLWDVDTGNVTWTANGHAEAVTAIAFSPDGSRILSGSDDKTLKVWDASTGQEMLTLEGHTKSIRDAAYSPNGSRIVSGSSDATLRIWDGTTGDPIAVLSRHEKEVTAVAYSPDGSRIASVSQDKTIKIWHAGTGEELLTLTGHKFWVNAVAFSPDGTRIISGATGNDPTQVMLWETGTAGTHEDAAAAAENAGDWYATAFHLGWLVALNPEDASLQERRATTESTLRRQGRATPPAVAVSDEQIKTYPGEMYANLLKSGSIVDAERRLREALVDHEKQATDSDMTLHLRSLLGASLMQQHEFTEAAPLVVDACVGLAESNSNWLPDALYRLSDLAEEWSAGESADEARQFFEQRLRQHPDNEDLMAALSDVLIHSTVSEDAKAFALVLRTQLQGRGFSTLGAGYFINGDFDPAIERLTKAVESHPNDSATELLLLALAHQKLNQSEQARGFYDQAIQQLHSVIKRAIVAPPIRNAWVHEGGAFRNKKGSQWLETRNQDSDVQFKEVDRNDQYVELFDRNRRLRLRLHSDFAEFRMGTDPSWKRRFPGRWDHSGRIVLITNAKLDHVEKDSQLVEQAMKRIEGLSAEDAKSRIATWARRVKLNRAAMMGKEFKIETGVYCYKEELYTAAARWYDHVFESDPKLAEDLTNGSRYNAACCAALAASGKGDGKELSESQRSSLRKRALGWLREDLVARASLAEKNSSQDRTNAMWALEYSQSDTDLSGIRDASQITKLPESEQQPLTEFWAEVAEVLEDLRVAPSRGPAE